MQVPYVESVVPAVVVFLVLFGLLSRRDPRPSNAVLFLQVALVGLVLAGVTYYVCEETTLLYGGWLGELGSGAWKGLAVGSGVLLLIAGMSGVLNRGRGTDG
jgi:hypothetical protein